MLLYSKSAIQRRSRRQGGTQVIGPSAGTTIIGDSAHCPNCSLLHILCTGMSQAAPVLQYTAVVYTCHPTLLRPCGSASDTADGQNVYRIVSFKPFSWLVSLPVTSAGLLAAPWVPGIASSRPSHAHNISLHRIEHGVCNKGNCTHWTSLQRHANERNVGGHIRHFLLAAPTLD